MSQRERQTFVVGFASTLVWWPHLSWNGDPYMTCSHRRNEHGEVHCIPIPHIYRTSSVSTNFTSSDLRLYPVSEKLACDIYRKPANICQHLTCFSFNRVFSMKFNFPPFSAEITLVLSCFHTFSPTFPALFFVLISLPVLGNGLQGSWMKTLSHASPHLANMGEAAWPRLNPDSVLARSGQLFSCSWCVLHPARLSLAACPTHYSQWRDTLLLLWFCLTRLPHSAQTAVPPCSSRWTDQKSCHYACKNLSCNASRVFVLHGFKFCSEANTQPTKKQPPSIQTSGLVLCPLSHCSDKHVFEPV